MTKGNNCDHQTPTDISCRDVDIRGNESDVMPPIHVLFTKGNCYIIKLGIVGTCTCLVWVKLMAMKIKSEWTLVIMENLEWSDWIFQIWGKCE